MAPKIKLTYFAARGRAELIRLILAAADVEYENVRIEFKDWPQLKPTMPCGTMPVLEYNDFVLAQSKTIARFLAKKFHLAGDTDEEQAQADMIVDYVVDYSQALRKLRLAESDVEKLRVGKDLIENFIPDFLSRTEAILQKRGGKHFAAGKLTWADIAMYQVLTGLCDEDTPIFVNCSKELNEKRMALLDGYLLLKDLSARVGQVKGIQRWLRIRPPNSQEPF